MFPELRTPPTETLPSLPAVTQSRDELAARWREILGPMPQPVLLETQVLEREELADHFRLLIRYRNDATSTNVAYLLLPKRRSPPLPAVVCFHPTSPATIEGPVGLDNRESVHHGLHLVKRGYVCIAPRNFLWNEQGRTWQAAAEEILRRGQFKTGMAKMLWDGIRAVDVLLERPEVDPKRIGAIGHSLGAKEALYLAAFDQRVRAAISCEGGVGLRLSNWDADWYLGKQINSPDFKHDHHEIMSLIAPRALLVIGGESADGAMSWPFIEACLPVWQEHGREEALGLLWHDEGHSFPSPGPDRELAYRWFDHFMGKEQR